MATLYTVTFQGYGQANVEILSCELCCFSVKMFPIVLLISCSVIHLPTTSTTGDFRLHFVQIICMLCFLLYRSIKQKTANIQRSRTGQTKYYSEEIAMKHV